MNPNHTMSKRTNETLNESFGSFWDQKVVKNVEIISVVTFGSHKTIMVKEDNNQNEQIKVSGLYLTP